jgi:penicillin amidase
MRWLIRIAAGLVGLVAIAAGALYLYVRQALPTVNGTLNAPGLAAPVDIVRDRAGVPHITAQTPDDALYALGFVHAQDRLWQMEMNRRIGSGRLSEVVGNNPRTIEADKFLRTLGVRYRAERSLQYLSDDTKRLLAAYARGVNGFLAQRTGPLPPEFLIMGVVPEPWTPVDSLVWVKMMAWDLSGNWRTELERLRLSTILSPDQMQDFFPPYPGDKPVRLPDLKQLYQFADAAGLRDALGRLAELGPDEPQVEGIGSNNWVIDGSRTATGKPLLANDPHLGLSAPALWYFAHMSAPGLEVMGATLPGVPAVVLGRNKRIAWGFTNTGPDTQDLFLEKIDPTDPGKYITPSGPQPFVTRQEVIKVKGADPIAMTVRETRHGPIISDALDLAREALGNQDKGYALAFQWTALMDEDRTADAAMGLAQAMNWDQFVMAVQRFDNPQQNMVYADVDGNIGYIAPARVPIRKPENDLKGLAPAPGWDARYDWAGFIPFEGLPKSYNPASHAIITANHKVVTDDYPYFLTTEWAEPYRAERIAELIAARQVHSVESFRQIQGDVRSGMIRDLLPAMLAVPQTDNAARQALALLAPWDGTAAADRPEALIFWAWYRQFTRLVSEAKFGPAYEAFWQPRPRFTKALLTDKAVAARWCPAADCTGLARQALELGLAELRKLQGDEMSRWRWGEAHYAKSTHMPFSNVAGLREIFEIRVPTGGDTYTVNVGRNRMNDREAPFASVHAASLRAIYDLADLDRSLFMHSTGQSGNPMSPRYADLAGPWAEVDYLPMSMNKADYEAGALGRLMLTPK